MKRFALVMLLIVLVFAGCKKKETPATTTPQGEQGGTASTAPGSAPTAATGEMSLVSFSAGALVVQKPQEYGGNWEAFNLLDENTSTGWAAPKGVMSPQATVIELPERSLLKRIEFDTAHADCDTCGAKDIDVEVSDVAPTSGFQKIASVELLDRTDHQQFAVGSEFPGRWVRLTVKNNWGSEEYTELMEFRAYGTQLIHTPFPDVSGTYDSTFGRMHLRQRGTSISGCYEHDDGLLTGSIEGRVMKLKWTQSSTRGPATMVFSSDGRNLFGLWWDEGNELAPGSHWDGPKISSTVGSCPNWKNVDTAR